MEGQAIMKGTRNLEFKETITNTFLKTVSAFANYSGGRILFGITDSGAPVGVKDTKSACISIENRINDSISPQPDYQLAARDDGVITLTVKKGKRTPYLYKSKAYKRNDTATIEVDPIELTRLILSGQNMDYEELPAENQDLSFHVLARKLEEEAGIGSFDQDILKTLELYSDQEGYNRAAEILADSNRCPGVDLVRFGENINVIRERQTVHHVSVLTAFDRAYSMYQSNYQYEQIRGMRREKVETVPSGAFREAVANALIHRTWDTASEVRIAMYDDRIDISSPVGLPAGISEEEYLTGRVSVLRNPFIARVFSRLHIVEGIGMGVQRIRDAYQDSPARPSFIVTENTIGIVLPVIKQSLDLPAHDQVVYDYLCSVPSAAISEIITATSYGKTRVTAILKRLTEQNLIERTGNGRGTRYRKKR